jgi:hypothetical protein
MMAFGFTTWHCVRRFVGLLEVAWIVCQVVGGSRIVGCKPLPLKVSPNLSRCGAVQSYHSREQCTSAQACIVGSAAHYCVNDIPPSSVVEVYTSEYIQSPPHFRALHEHISGSDIRLPAEVPVASHEAKE